MEVFEHRTEIPILFGNGLKRYALDGVVPAVVVDATRGIQKPSDGGGSLTGSFDILYDAVIYHGVAAPFVIADLGATLVRAFPAAWDISADYILLPGGARTTAPGEDFIPGDTDLWSVSDG